MDPSNFTIPVQQLRGYSIRRGAFPGWWIYPNGSPTTYDCAVSGLYRSIYRMVTATDGTGRQYNYCPLRY